MSLHLDQQCQRAQNTSAPAHPSLEGPALAASDLMTKAMIPGKAGAQRCGDIHLGRPPKAVNAFLHFFDRRVEKAAEEAGFTLW